MKRLIKQIIEVTSRAAIAAYAFKGLGDEKAADEAAVESMRKSLNALPISGTIVIGEGERDQAPMLYIGEKVGMGGTDIDIAVDPLEGTTILATGGAGALTVIACAKKDALLHAPDLYMEKIAIGFDFPERIIDLDLSPEENLKNIARAQKCKIGDLSVTILDRPRHQDLIEKVRISGAKINLIGDGDIAAVIETTFDHRKVYMGIGGAPEGVLAASALKTTGGQICGKLLFKSSNNKSEQYFLNDMVKSDVLFAATGVTDGPLLKGVRYENGKVITETLMMFSRDKTIQKVRSHHDA